MQFAARMDFTFAPETIELCSQISQEELATERIGTEWEKLFLQGKTISTGLKFLKECRWITFYPELEELSQKAWKKTLVLLDGCASLRTGERQSDLLFMTAAAISELSPQEGAQFCSRLWNRKELAGKAVRLAEKFREVAAQDPLAWGKAQVRRLALELDGVKLLCALLDGAGKNTLSDFFAVRAEECGVFDRPPVPLLSGRHAIEAGVEPGAALGSLLKKCFEAQLDGLFEELDGAKVFLKKLLEEAKNEEN